MSSYPRPERMEAPRATSRSFAIGELAVGVVAGATGEGGVAGIVGQLGLAVVGVALIVDSLRRLADQPPTT